MKNLTKKLLLTTGLIVMSATSFAENKAEVSAVSANITIANDYIWRGETQSDDKKAIQGGLDYDIGNGFALGVWGSNVDFGGASSEFDIYGSYSGELDSGVGYEIGYISYTYNEKDNDFEEAYVAVSYEGFGLTQYKGVDDASDNLELSYNLDLSGVDTTLVYGDYKDINKYHSVTFAKSFNELDYAVAWNKSKPDAGGSSSDNTVFSISKSF
ncbi:MAG: TorF family putative porin [Gammaproteobacteria bacterium]|nr:TorF family putative porin [Gammaproteobacteria bacterium]